MCGFDPFAGSDAVPSSSSYSRFLTSIIKHEDVIYEIFHNLVESIRKVLPDFVKTVAFDGKAIGSCTKGRKKQSGNKENSNRRRDDDADCGLKKYQGVNEDRSLWVKIKSWFGFRLHLIIDAQHEFPIAFEVTKASTGEQPVIREMFDDLAEEHPEIVEDCEYGMGDKGYDSVETIRKLLEEYGIKTVIDIKNMWKDGEVTRTLKSGNIENVTYDYKGTVFCHCPVTEKSYRMAYCGFEKDRNTLKYTCPAKHY